MTSETEGIVIIILIVMLLMFYGIGNLESTDFLNYQYHRIRT